MFNLCRFIKEKRINIVLGLIFIMFGAYFTYELFRVLFEDIKYDFGILRLLYLWYWQYVVIHLWIYLVFMFVSAVLIIANRKSKFLEFSIIGLLCFFCFNCYYHWSFYSFILFMLYFFYYYCNFIKAIINFKIFQTYKMKIIYIVIHVVFIYISNLLGITINMAIHERFGF